MDGAVEQKKASPQAIQAKAILPSAGSGASPARRPQAVPDRVYGALDLGTNNCRLLIVRPTPDGFRVLDAYSRIVRLGEGLATSGRLSEAAMSRAIAALRVCAEKIQRRGVERVRTVATAACRAAENGAEFVELVKARTGLTLDVVTTADEARLAVLGCSPLLDRQCRSVLVFDIGGGSTELIWVEVPVEGVPRIADWTSLPYGVVTLADRYGGVEVPPGTYQAMVDEVSAALGAFAARRPLTPEISARGFHLLGTSGTVTTVAGIHLGLERYDRNKVDGVWVGSEDVVRVTGELLAMDFAARAANPCIGRERADLVLAGCAILEAITQAWPSQRLRVADRGLREGILLSLMNADKARGRRRRGRRGRRKGRGVSTPAAVSTQQG
ncbi:MAG: Ppx/GppA phosphatase family protein [Parvibaculaceae bacterium]|nr:Ppx/GppA phosphatase family protein [Parvibaculaceae bacterium]